MTSRLPAPCLSARAALLLGEFGPKHRGRLEAEEHIGACEGCRRFVDRETDTAVALRAAAAAAASLADGKMRTPVVLLRGRPRRRSFRATLAVAAALLVGAAVSALLLHRGRSPDVVGAIFRDHMKYLTAARPADVLSSDPGVITSWSQQKFGFVPRLVRPGGFDLLGARRCTIAGNTVALVFYQKEHCRISLLVGDQSRWPLLPARFSSGQMALISAVHGRLIYVAVGDLTAEELASLLPAQPST